MNVFDSVLNFISMFSLRDAIDIAIMAFLIYKLIKLISGSNAGKVVKGIIFLILAMQVAQLFGLKVVNYILANTMQVGLIALVVVFQPELRKALEKVGRSTFPQLVGKVNVDDMERVIKETVDAATAMSWARDGALIVFERQIKLNDFVKTGTVIDSRATTELIKNIFYPKAPLHDGAVIVQDGRLSAAGCMLPLTANNSLSKELGMRHRAGIGVSEQSDAVVVIVSEESGSISVAIDGMIKRHLSPETLERLLRNELMSEVEEEKKNGIFGFLRVKK